MLKASGAVSKLFAVLLLLAPLNTFSLIAAVVVDPRFGIATVVWVLLYLVVAVMAIVDAMKIFRRGDAEALGSSARLVKYCSIPFFTTNFVLLAGVIGGVVLFSSMFAAGVVTGTLAAIAVPILVVGTFLIMLPTSTYGIAGAVLLRRQGRAGTTFTVVNVILHLIFVLDIFSTLVVADRAEPGPTRPARMVRWIAGVVVMALLVPTGLFIVDTPGRIERGQVQQQRSDALAALPGVARVTGMTAELAQGVTFAQAQAIAVKGYTLQDSTNPSESARWTLIYGSTQHVLMGTQAEPVATQALVLLGPAVLDDRLQLDITASQRVQSGEQTAFTRIEGLTPGRGKAYTEATAKIIRVLAVADPKTAMVVGSVQANRWYVVGDRLLTATTADQLDALGALLSDDVALADLTLSKSKSVVTLTVKDDAQIATTCQLGLTALKDLPGLTLAVHTSRTSVRDAQRC